MGINTEYSLMFLHAKRFLLSCLQNHNAGDNKPHIHQATLLEPIPIKAKAWAKERFRILFPTLQAANPAATSIAPAASITPALEALLARLLPALTPPVRQHEEKKDDDDIVLSHPESQALLLMCGQPSSAPSSELPAWIIQCKEKGMTEQFKLTVIRKHMMSNFKFDDAEVPLTAPLLKMVNKRSWMGKDGNIRRPSLLNAMEGLSPFIVVDLDEDQVADINEADEAASKATHVTLQDIKNMKKKMKASVPDSADQFMLLLKRYANLLFAIFTENCPLFRCVVLVISALRDYSRAARDAMTKRTKASVLWIVLLQSRRFSVGEMDILADFTWMQQCLASKTSEISHAEVPNDLFHMQKSQMIYTLALLVGINNVALVFPTYL